MVKIGIGAVEYDDFALGHIGADFAGSRGIGLAGDIDQDEPGQKALEIKAHVAFGGGLAAAVLGPIHAGCDQLDGGGIDDVDGLAKAMSDALAASSVGEARRKRLEMGEYGPEELLGQKRLALLVGMRKPVAAGRSRAPDGRKGATVNA